RGPPESDGRGGFCPPILRGKRESRNRPNARHNYIERGRNLEPRTRSRTKGISIFHERRTMTPEQNFEKALQEIRDEKIDPSMVEAAAQRAWTHIAEAAGPATIVGCAG